MEEMTMLELYKTNLSNKEPLFPSENFPFMSEYVSNYKHFDKLFARNRHFFYYKDVFADDTTTESDILEDFQFDVNSLLLKNKDSLQKIWDASQLDYVPIENYLMSESGKDTNSATNSNTQKYGNVSKSNSYGTDVLNVNTGDQERSNIFGAQTNSNSVTKTGTETTVSKENVDTNLGKVTKTENVGAVSNSDEIGVRTDETKNAVSGYNVSSMTDSDVSTTVNGAQSNTHSENARVNSEVTDSIDNLQTTDVNNTLTHNTTDATSESFGTHTDVQKDGQRVDTQTRMSREDSENVQHDADTQNQTSSGTTEHTFSRHGNIGVTTTQRMLQWEFDLRLNFIFYDIIFDLIIKELCSFSDTGFDSFLTPFYNNMLY